MILTCSSQNHQDAHVYTTALQAIFSRIYWIFFNVPSRAKLHYNTTGDFNMLISKPSDAQGLHYNTTGNIFAHILDFFRCSFVQSYTTTLQVILTCSSQTHQMHKVYTTTLQALFSRMYWIFLYIHAHTECTGDFNM